MWLTCCSWLYWRKWGNKRMNKGFKFPAQTLYKWPKRFCIYPVRNPYLLYPQSRFNQTQSLILGVTELQYKLKSQLLMASSVKMMHWLGRKWSRNLWVLLGDIGDMKSLNSAGSFLPVETAISPLLKEVGFLLPEKLVMVSSEVVTLQSTDYSPQHVYLPLLFILRPITSFKSQQAPKSEIRSVTYEDLHYIPKELHDFSSSYRQKSKE